ncbi:oxidoreductase-like protein [Phaeosphaeriaceae sp. PMI808]|nr:oxidoreductase-like protein [Phaeosphaeriaceae sp. PMI808]
MKFSNLIRAALLAQQCLAHPGQSTEEHAQEVAERQAYLNANPRSLADCADALRKRGNHIAMHQRRAAQVAKLQAKRAAETTFHARDLNTVLNTNHHSNLTGITVDSESSVLFSGNNSCILSPETTQGPYWVQGELVREDITDGQKGVPLTLDIQIIDVNTCKPVPKAFLEIWHCNSTGVYSGVVANGNGNVNDASNLNKTFHRGIQKSDEDGVVVFETSFPGHYIGRATHIHVMTSLDATVNANETLSGGSITHVGQMFFDQVLITLVEKQEPYASNTQVLTTNAKDGILSREAATVDPFVEYILLGDSIADGIFGWLAFGINTGASYNIAPAVYLTGNGGVENKNAGAGMGGAPPSGSVPTDPSHSQTPSPSTSAARYSSAARTDSIA